nr:transposase [Corallococcus exiguus]
MSRAEDGRIAWRMKRPLPDGTTHLFFTGLELLRRVASLIPPPRSNLTRFHGVFAPGAKLRPFLLPQAEAEAKPERGPHRSRAGGAAPPGCQRRAARLRARRPRACRPWLPR